VVSVGTSHAWGGPAAALAALRGHVTDNGLVLVGEGVWDSEPPAAAREIFGDLPGLPGLTDLATAADFRPLYVGSSSLDEFDAWESDWRAGLELSGLPEARELADRRRVEYLRSYRGVLGFAWLILTPG
jgi:pimeloyl-ACP methyl ester carboxylesterase